MCIRDRPKGTGEMVGVWDLGLLRATTLAWEVSRRQATPGLETKDSHSSSSMNFMFKSAPLVFPVPGRMPYMWWVASELRNTEL